MELLDRTDAPIDADVTATTPASQPEAEETQPEANATTENVKEEPTREGLLETVTIMARQTPPAEISTEEVARIKQQFYSLQNNHLHTLRTAFIEAGGDPEAFTPEQDAIEEQFKACS